MFVTTPSLKKKQRPPQSDFIEKGNTGIQLLSLEILQNDLPRMPRITKRATKKRRSIVHNGFVDVPEEVEVEVATRQLARTFEGRIDLKQLKSLKFIFDNRNGKCPGCAPCPDLLCEP